MNEAVRKGIVTRHTLSEIELAFLIVTAEQYEREGRRALVFDSDTTVAMLADSIAAHGTDKHGRPPHSHHSRLRNRP